MSGSRLMILKMEVENFKSYGGVKEIGPFHKSFSSVVGPNGSGKSNVIDCMLFVFGKKSSKLRLSTVCKITIGDLHRASPTLPHPLKTTLRLTPAPYPSFVCAYDSVFPSSPS